MLFSSITFLYYFLPWALLFYFLSGRYKNLVLFLTSLVFYAWGEPIYVFLMVFLTGIGYVFGILAEKYRESVWKKYLVGISVAAALFILGYFKYADFVVENVARVTGSAWELPGIVLPIGISFYTFQMISYVIDVGRGQKLRRISFLWQRISRCFPSWWQALLCGILILRASWNKEYIPKI